MKLYYILLSAILFLSLTTHAQQVVLTEDFTHPSQTNVVSVIAGDWSVAEGAWKSRQHSGNENPTLIQARIAKLITGQDTDVRVRWTGNREANGGLQKSFDSDIFLCYKTGANGNVVKVQVDAEKMLNMDVNKEVIIPLSNNYFGVEIYFETTTVHGYSYYIDNLEIVTLPNMFKWDSRPLGEDPFVTSAPNAANPYQLNEAFMAWSMTKAANVGLETLAVNNTQHPRSSQTLSVVQSGASKTEGTHVKIQFSAMMADVSFNILDVDKSAATNQYKDSVVVTGVNNAGKVVLATKSFVRNSVNTQFYPQYSSFVGLQNVDNSTEQGDITVVFAEEIKEVNISYYNQGTDKGRQAISIGNFNGYQTVSPLPVELMWFKGAVQGANTVLTWATAQEIDNDKFIVERSLDGKTFSQIGQVRGHGNSSVVLTYTFTDTDPAEGTNYYRLRQVDLDGTAETFKIVALLFKGIKHALNGSIAKVYPTLAASEVSISLALSQAQVQVLDAGGRQMAQYSNAGQCLVLPVSHLQPGVYFVKVSDGQQQETHRFVKQ